MQRQKCRRTLLHPNRLTTCTSSLQAIPTEDLILRNSKSLSEQLTSKSELLCHEWKNNLVKQTTQGSKQPESKSDFTQVVSLQIIIMIMVMVMLQLLMKANQKTYLIVLCNSLSSCQGSVETCCESVAWER